MMASYTDRADPYGGKRPRQTTADDAGTPLSDELLLAIFDGVPGLAELVRLAATCRRWRRLVSGDAAFLCRKLRRLPGGFLSPPAIGFFHHHQNQNAANANKGPRFSFAPRGPVSPRFPGLARQPSVSSLFAGDRLFDSSRVVASRNGLVVVELRRGTLDDGELRLCVCNPLSGAVHVLPPLAGKGRGHGHYACAVITADDYNDETGPPPPRPSSYFRLVMLYTRHGSTSPTLHTYSPDAGRWSEEAQVTNAYLSNKQLRQMRGGIVEPGGRVVVWLAKNVAAVLILATLRLAMVSVPRCVDGQNLTMANTLLGFSPEGELCLVQFDRMSLSPAKRKRRVSIGVFGFWTNWGKEESIQVDAYLPEDTTKVSLRWFCERSGVVFFSAVAGDSDHRRSDVYALSLHTRAVEKVMTSQAWDDCDWGDIYGYDVDQTACLASLAERDGNGKEENTDMRS